MVDKAAEPLGFLDAALRCGFLAAFQAMGGEYRGGCRGERRALRRLLAGRGAARAAATTLTADIVFAAFGRVANLDGIGLDRLGSTVSSRGHVEVERALRDQHSRSICRGRCDRTAGARLRGRRSGPARRAGRLRVAAARPHEPGADRRVHHPGDRLRRPVAGARRRRKKIDVIVGRADFSEVARAHIAGEPRRVSSR